jgi:CubicO group peptidase (beta-lactamase class C family)
MATRARSVRSLARIGWMLLACAAGPWALAQPPALPSPANFGFWSPTEEEFGFRSMERIFPTHVIHRGESVAPLPYDPAGAMRINFEYQHRRYSVDDFMKINRSSAVLVVQDGKILLERYALGRRPEDRWTSFSIAKSVTSTLVGAAIQDGYIHSVQDPVTQYLPQLKGPAFNGVTIEDMLLMSSGVKWNEHYDDPDSDFNKYATDMGDRFLKLMASRPRVATPGEKFAYSTADASIVGAVVMAATGKSLADYLSEKIWAPFGMEQDGVWMTSASGKETGGICFSATTRDYARFGMFMLADGVINGKRVLPAGWVADATRSHIATTFAPFGYGYYWWTREHGVYQGIGIFGQSLYIDPSRRLVIVVQSAWSTAGNTDNYALESAFFEGVTQLLDARAVH